MDKLTTWMADLHGKIPRFSPGLDETPSISLLEPIEALVDIAWVWPDLDQLNQQTGHWLLPLAKILIRLKGVYKMPPGPGLLYKLEETKSGASIFLEQSTGYLPLESQARAITEGLRTWINYLIIDFDFTNRLEMRAVPTSLLAGTFSEFSVEIQSKSVLPLLNLRIETIPHWGSAEVPYLAEQGRFTLNLRGDVPQQAEQLSLRFQWHATTLSTLSVGSTIELAIRVVKPEQASMQFASNLGSSPYVTGSPLEPKHGHNVFYGRENLIGQISRQIATHGNVVLLEGNRRAGKTSILKHLEGYSTTPGWLAVYASLQGAEGSAQAVGVPTEGVFREIARSIAVALSKLSIDVPLPNGQTLSAGKPALGVAQACREGISIGTPFHDFREYLEVVLAVLEPLGLGLVLMLDEFDKLQEGIDSGVTSPQVPDNIRFMIQSYPKFSAILTGSRRLKRMREEYWSALYGLGTSFSVTVLDPESARKVIIEPVRDRLTFSREAIERLIEVTARHPYLMQCLCNRVFDYAVQTMSRSITVSVVNDTVHGLVRDNEHFASLWDYAARGPKTGRHRRHMILLLCALSFKQGTHVDFGTLHEQLTQVGVEVNDEALDTDLSYLRELELIDFSGEIGDGEYRLAIPMMAEWIEQQQDADVVSSHARAEAEEENV
ncbi:ATP-binding protein [Janthinobacterium sp. MP5059B]|uniref:ATP-binding protein n=1 Tax=Janthinobacterium sp. MP5059B TaxID=1766683 RepID=UPI0011130707|nr:ATP-binding protein [Janthinobacterium sp. MP5059B]